MPEVELIIGGFSHRVVCKAGQEERVQALGSQVAALVTRLAEDNPGHSPTRLLMLAALQFADKADELERQSNRAIIHGERQDRGEATSSPSATASSEQSPDTPATGNPASDNQATNNQATNNQAAQNKATARAQDQILQATQLYLAEVFEEMASRLEGMERDLNRVEGRLPADQDVTNGDRQTANDPSA